MAPRGLNIKSYVDDPRTPGAKVCVSTVKLSIDHGYGGTPLWYETYIFQADPEGTEIANWSEEWGTRYTTEQQAEDGHASVLATIERGEWPS